MYLSFHTMRPEKKVASRKKVKIENCFLKTRSSLVGLVAILLAMSEVSGVPKCPAMCPMCPEIPPCPTPICPVPTCPPLPNVPPCPPPRCPTLPPIPACPTPTLNLSCPEMNCPNSSCPACPACPDHSPCPSCPTKQPRTLPIGYSTTPNLGTHKYYPIPKTYNEANLTCAEDGGYLAIPDSMEELRLYLRLMAMHAENIIHIGFHDILHEGLFISVLGQPMTAVQKQMWGVGEPSIDSSADCAYLGGFSRALYDGRCTDLEPYVCEISP